MSVPVLLNDLSSPVSPLSPGSPIIHALRVLGGPQAPSGVKQLVFSEMRPGDAQRRDHSPRAAGKASPGGAGAPHSSPVYLSKL